MKLILILVTIWFVSCTEKYISQTIELDLSNQGLKQVPDSVFTLSHLQYLNLGNNLTMYPPLSALGDAGESNGDSLNQIRTIPAKIVTLTNLKTLSVCFTDLQSLPDEISQLKKLETLDISFNQSLVLKNEIEKLSRMQWLKYLNILGTDADEEIIRRIRVLLPNTKIVALDEIIEKLRTTLKEVTY